MDYTEFTITMKVSVPADEAHVMLEFPEAIQDGLKNSPIRLNSMSVHNDTLEEELAS